MGLGVSIFLIAVGAILTWAVNASVSGLELDTIGVILMIVGAIGLLTSLLIWGPRSRRSTRTVAYDEGYAPPTTGRRVTREETYHDV